MTKPNAPTKKVKLALQGGGSYGAFTWGVLDRLLEDPRIEITSVSGASAGALNAAALAQGWDKNRHEGARESLRKLWTTFRYEKMVQKVPKVGNLSAKFARSFSGLSKYIHEKNKSKAFKGLQSAFQAVVIAAASNMNRVFERVIDEAIDTTALKNNPNGLPFFVSATDIDRHEAHIFDRSDISAKALEASCAIPIVIGTVEVDGRRFWDGGLTENPAILPLEDFDGDLIVVQTFPIVERTPEEADKMPVTRRLTELISNSGVRKYINDIQRDNARYDKNPKAAKTLGIKKTHTHVINGGQSVDSGHALNFDPNHIEKLYHEGRAAADAWLKAHFDDIGVQSTYKADYDKQKQQARKSLPKPPKKTGP